MNRHTAKFLKQNVFCVEWGQNLQPFHGNRNTRTKILNKNKKQLVSVSQVPSLDGMLGQRRDLDETTREPDLVTWIGLNTTGQTLTFSIVDLETQ